MWPLFPPDPIQEKERAYQKAQEHKGMIIELIPVSRDHFEGSAFVAVPTDT